MLRVANNKLASSAIRRRKHGQNISKAYQSIARQQKISGSSKIISEMAASSVAKA